MVISISWNCTYLGVLIFIAGFVWMAFFRAPFQAPFKPPRPPNHKSPTPVTQSLLASPQKPLFLLSPPRMYLFLLFFPLRLYRNASFSANVHNSTGTKTPFSTRVSLSTLPQEWCGRFRDIDQILDKILCPGLVRIKLCVMFLGGRK